MKDYGYYNNANYEKLESKYLETKDETILKDMYLFLEKYYGYKVKTYLKKKDLYFEKEEILDLAERMAERSIMHYIYHPKIKGDFKMGKLSAYACYDFKKIMFDEKEIEITKAECSLDEIMESWDNNQPLFDKSVFDSELDKTDLLIDAERRLPEKEYNILKVILDCSTITVEDLVEEFEMPRKQINKLLNNIYIWYKEEEI